MSPVKALIRTVLPWRTDDQYLCMKETVCQSTILEAMTVSEVVCLMFTLHRIGSTV